MREAFSVLDISDATVCYTFDDRGRICRDGRFGKGSLFVRNLLSFLVPGRTHKCITVREDNEGAISLANNPLSSARSRHIDVRHHFLREKVADGTVRIIHVRTADQHADGMTKPLEKKDFIIHRKFLMG